MWATESHQVFILFTSQKKKKFLYYLFIYFRGQKTHDRVTVLASFIGCNANICNHTNKVLRFLFLFLFWSFARLVGAYRFRGFIILYICCDD